MKRSTLNIIEKKTRENPSVDSFISNLNIMILYDLIFRKKYPQNETSIISGTLLQCGNTAGDEGSVRRLRHTTGIPQTDLKLWKIGAWDGAIRFDPIYSLAFYGAPNANTSDCELCTP